MLFENITIKILMFSVVSLWKEILTICEVFLSPQRGVFPLVFIYVKSNKKFFVIITILSIRHTFSPLKFIYWDLLG